MLKKEDSKGTGLNILVVDDDELNQRLLNLVLAQNGNTVSFSYDGYDAVKVLEKKPFDLVFLDIQIPRIDGFEVCEHVRSGSSPNQQTPIVALTALPSRDQRLQDFLDRGMFNECIQKPFNAAQLQEILSAVADKKEFGSRLDEFALGQGRQEMLILNVEKVMPIFGGDMDTYKELFGEFLDGLPERVESMKRAEAESDWKSLSRLAHNMTGITRNFGTEKLSALSQELDAEAANENTSVIHDLIGKIADCVPELNAAYKSLAARDS